MRKLVLVVAVLFTVLVMAAPTFAQGRTIVDIAVADSRFDTLAAAVTAAGLADTLASPGPFTVFAPTDAAFDALGADTINSLLADPEGALTDILLYHVVAGEVPASAVVGLSSAPTVLGRSIKIDIEDGGVVLDRRVNVIITDVQASNGIIHVIDAVLLPPSSIAGNDMVLITGDANVEATSLGENTGNVVRTCQTFYVTAVANGALRLRDVPGWVDARVTSDVPENYGIPGGTPVLPQCVGR
jgi:uncharacterized surface protein with fasciclin (FAS1) repeats